MDSCGLLIHQRDQGADPAAMASMTMDCMSELNDTVPALSSLMTAPSQPCPLKRPYFHSCLSRSNSLVSGVDDRPLQLLHHDGSVSSPYVCATKFQKGLLSRSNSSTFQGLNREDIPLSFISHAYSFNNGEVVHPSGSSFSFASTMPDAANEEAVNPMCGSPDTSITTEYKDVRFSQYNFHLSTGHNLYSEGHNLYSLITTSSDEELFSVLPGVPYGCDSISSDVTVSPHDYNSIYSLVDSLLYDLPQVEGYGENHSASAVQFIPSQIETFICPMLHIGVEDDSETRDLNSQLKYKGGKSDVLAGVCLLEHQNSSSNRGDCTWTYEKNLEGTDKNLQPAVPDHSSSRPEYSGNIGIGQCVIKPSCDQLFLNIGDCHEGLGPDKSLKQDISVVCDNIAEKPNKLGGFEDKVADLSSLIKQEVVQSPSLDFQALAKPITVDPSCDPGCNGIRLVHLLVATAEAIACCHMDLASVILIRLRELVSQTGSTMQRVSSYFTDGLQSRIEGGQSPDDATASGKSRRVTLAAFQILHEVSPYIKFGHFTANQAILEAVEGERRVHILDFEIMEGIQWPSFMQSLASKPGICPHLHITAVYRSYAKRGLATVQETGKRLTDFAVSLNLPFTYSQVRIDNDEDFDTSVLKVVRGEILVVNCVLHLPHMPHRTSSSVDSFLQGVRKLYPAVVTLVEDELGYTTSDFTSYFFEALHYYSAMFDSLEASLLSQTTACILVERVFFAPRITNAITFCGLSGNLENKVSEQTNHRWNSLVNAAGFKTVPFSIYNMCQAKLLLGLFKDGFKVEEDCNRLLLAWRGKSLIAASVFNCN